MKSATALILFIFKWPLVQNLALISILSFNCHVNSATITFPRKYLHCSFVYCSANYEVQVNPKSRPAKACGHDNICQYCVICRASLHDRALWIQTHLHKLCFNGIYSRMESSERGGTVALHILRCCRLASDSSVAVYVLLY